MTPLPVPPPTPTPAVIVAALDELKAAPHVDEKVKVAVAVVAEKTAENAAKLDAMGQWSKFLETPIGKALAILILAVLGLATAYVTDKLRPAPVVIVVPEKTP